MPQSPTFARYQSKRKKKGKAKLVSLISFGGKKASPQKAKTSPSPTQGKPEGRSDKAKLQGGVASGLASLSNTIPSGGYTGILKAALAGAAAGAKIEASYTEYKSSQAKKKAKAAKTTVSQSAMSQKAQFHKKEHSKTEKY